MKLNSKAFAVVAVVGYLAIAALIAVVVTPAPTGRKAAWYSFHSWGKHKPADKFDAAKAADASAVVAVDLSSAALVHQAAIEVDKAKRAGASLPPSVATDTVRRTVDNAAGALNQVSPLTSAENQANVSIVLGLLSTETALRQAAEAKQSDAEKALAAKSDALAKAEADRKAIADKLAAAGEALRTGFEERNALANELEAGRMKRNALLALAVLLCLGLLYCKVALSGVGRALHMADNTAFANVAGHINTELGAVGQWLIRSGRVALAKKEAAAAAIEKGNVTVPETSTSAIR